jgi:hypothetical protein
MTSRRHLRAASALLCAVLSGDALPALVRPAERRPEWRVFLAASEVTGTVAPVEAGGVLLVDAAALAPSLGMSVRVELTDAVIRDVLNRDWRGTAGGLALTGPTGELPLPRPLRIENRSVYLPLTTLADLAALSLEVDPVARIARLDRPAAGGASLPEGWQALSLPKPKQRRGADFATRDDASGGPPPVLPPAHENLRLRAGVEHLEGDDWGADLVGSGSIRGLETRLAARATAGRAGSGIYSGILGLYEPQGYGFEAGDLFSEIWGQAQGVRLLGSGTGSDARNRLSFSFYRPSATGANRRSVLTGSDEMQLGKRTRLSGEIASDGSWAVRTRHHWERFGLVAYGRQALAVLSTGLAAFVELPAALALQASWNRIGSGRQAIDSTDASLLVPVLHGANFTLGSSEIAGATTRLKTDALAFALPLGPLNLRTAYQRRDGEFRFGEGPRSSYGQRDLVSTLTYRPNGRLRFDLLAVDRRPDRGTFERWQQLAFLWKLRTGTQLQVVATTKGSPYRDPLHLRVEQELPRGFSIFAEYGRIAAFDEAPSLTPPLRLKLMVRKIFDLPTPAGGGEVSGTVGSALGPAAAGVPVELGPYRTTTDGEGRFAFRHVAPGDYPLAVAPQGVPASFAAGAPQRVAVAARRRRAANLALTPLGVVSGEVYLDRNNDGRKDEDEGLSGVILRLDDLATASREDGTFEFLDVTPGSHRLRVDPDRLPTGVALSIPSALDLGLPAGGSLERVQFRLVEKKRPIIFQEVGR